MRVLFGRKHGEQTEGVIVKVNRAKFKVRQVGSRGSFVDHADGTLWNVPATLCTPLDVPGTVNALGAYQALRARHREVHPRQVFSSEEAGIQRGMRLMRRSGVE